MYDEGELAKRMLLKATRIGAKLGDKLAKMVLKVAVNRIKENQQNKVGLTSLKKLVNSKEKISLVRLNKTELEAFKEKAKELRITFASVGSKDSDELKILFKSKQEDLVKEVLKDMQEKANKLDYVEEKKTYDFMANLDFKEIGENLYRHEEVMNTDQITSMKEELAKKGIDAEVVIKDVVDNDKFKVDFKINHKDREKVKKPLDLLIDKAITKTKEQAREIPQRVVEKVKEVIER